MIQKTFTIPCTTKSIQDKDTQGNDTLYLTGIANTGLEDLVGDVVTRQALESIAEQIPMHNLHMDHDHDWTGIVGRMTEGWVEDDGVHFKARILRERSSEIQSYLDQDIIMGASISGCCEYEDNSISDIVDWQLTEISLTPIPCDQATLGSVVVAKSFLDAVRGLQKRNIIEGDKMAETNDEAVTIEKVEEMINTAFNEKQEDLVEVVTQKVSEEYESKLNELVARVETLENQNDEEDTNDEGEAAGEGEESPVISGEGEAKATDEEEEDKPADEEDEEDDKATDGEEEEEDKPEEEEEDEEDKAFLLTDEIRKAVREEIQKVFKAPASPDFQYTEDKKNIKNDDEGNVAGKAYTPRELAMMLTRTQ